MAITREVGFVADHVEDRTWRINIETPLGGPYSVQVYRQDVEVNAAGEKRLASQAYRQIDRMAADVVDDTVEVEHDGQKITVTGALVMAALPLFADKWVQQNEEREAARVAALEEADRLAAEQQPQEAPAEQT